METYGYVLYVYGDKHLIEMSFYHQLMYGSFISTKVHIWSDVFILWMDSSFPDAGFHVHWFIDFGYIEPGQWGPNHLGTTSSQKLPKDFES